MQRIDEQSYLARTSSGRARSRWSWVGTMCDVVTRCRSMSSSIPSGVPLVHEHDLVAHVQRVGRPEQHGGVVQRRAGDVHVAVVGLHAEQRQEQRVQRGELVGVHVDPAPLHALGLAGRARRVVHRRRRRCGRSGVCRAGRRCSSSKGRKPATSPMAKRRRRGVAELGDHLGELVGEALVADQRLGLGVGDDVGDLGADEVVVDRRDVEPDLRSRPGRRDHLDAVRQHEGERVVGPQAEGCGGRGDPVGERGQLAGGELGAVGGDERLAVGVGGGDAEEPKI